VLDGVRKISGVDNLKFRYYKNFKSKDATLENLDITIPKNPEDYGISRTNTQMENYKNFFDKSYVESVDLLENELTIKKPYAEKVITKAKKGTLHDRRQVLKMIQDKEAVAKLFDEIGPKYEERNGGYTRITRTTYRKGDKTELAILELV